jgi:hypothetical protein
MDSNTEVYSVRFWLSDAHNSAVNVTKTKLSRTAYFFEQLLNFEIKLFPVICCMEREETKVTGLSEIRFRWIIFFLRITGIPFKMKKMSTLYVIYMTTVIICTCSTFLGMFVDVYIHRDDLGHVMTTIRILAGIVIDLWIYFSLR